MLRVARQLVLKGRGYENVLVLDVYAGSEAVRHQQKASLARGHFKFINYLPRFCN
jgi:hypothetical protein